MHTCTNVLRGFIHACLNVWQSALKAVHRRCIPHITRRLVLLVSPCDLTTSRGSEIATASFGAPSSDVASSFKAVVLKPISQSLRQEDVTATTRQIRQQGYETGKALKTAALGIQNLLCLNCGGHPRLDKCFSLRKYCAMPRCRKQPKEQDAGNLLNGFDSSFNRPWQDFNKFPTKSWSQWGWRIAVRGYLQWTMGQRENCENVQFVPHFSLLQLKTGIKFVLSLDG